MVGKAVGKDDEVAGEWNDDKEVEERRERGRDQRVWKREGKNDKSRRRRSRTVVVSDIAVLLLLLLGFVGLDFGIKWKFQDCFT